MKNKKTLMDIILDYKQLLIITTLLFVVFGTVALFNMPRDEFPEFSVRKGLVIGIYPGATSHQVEEQLTKKVENYLFQYEEIDKEKTVSISKENVMVVYVEVQRKLKQPKLFWAKLRNGLDDFKSQLPSGVMSLSANEDFGNTSAILLAVESETKTYKELEKYIETFEDDVRAIPATSRVKHFGLQEEEINVYIDDAKLAYYGVKPLTVIAALRPEGMVNYAGEIDDGEYIRPIHIPSGYNTESDIANQIVYSDPTGQVVRVKDIAKVVREYKEPDSFIRFNGKKCLIISLEMQPGNNIVQYGAKVNKVIDKFKSEVPSDVNVGLISDMPHFVSESILHFLKEFALAIIAVILVTVLLLPKRVAFVAASAIPISVLMTVGMLWMFGISLQTVSLAGLIIVLGMVVDNAIVIIDNYVEKLDQGVSPHDAASKSVGDLFGSVFFATLIIVVCFLPMTKLMTGLAGDFVRSLPVTIAIALFLSLIVSVLLVPLMSYTFIKHGIKSNSESEKRSFLDRLQAFYDNLLEKSFRNKKVIVLVGILSFVLGLLMLLITPQKPFPAFQRNQFAVEVYLPVGSSLQQTDRVIQQVETLLLKDSRVEDIAAFVGSSSPRFNSLYAPQFPAKHYGQLLVITESNKATEDILNEYSVKYRNYFPNAHVKWKQLEMVTSDAAIEVRFTGPDIKSLKKAGNALIEQIQTLDGVQWARTNYKEPLQSVQLNLKEDQASRMGYSKTYLDYSLLIGTKGFPVSTIWEDDYPVDVNLRIDKKVKSDMSDIMDMYVTSMFMATAVPVRQLADAEQTWSEGEIVHRNGVRTLTVSVDPMRGYYASDLLAQIEPMIAKLNLSDDISVHYGGELEMQVEEMTPLYYSLAISIAIIFLILLFQFKSIKKSVLIMVTMPLSLFGAALGVLVNGYPFSVTAFIGLIGLFGIVVRNGIIYLSYADELRFEHGMEVEQAAISAAKRRMRPIFLTAAAAAVGVFPMVISRSPLWGPLGSVISFGLLFALVLSLLVLPVLYSLAHRNELKVMEN